MKTNNSNGQQSSPDSLGTHTGIQAAELKAAKLKVAELEVADLHWIWKGVGSCKNPYLHLRKTYPWEKLGYEKESFFEPR